MSHLSKEAPDVAGYQEVWRDEDAAALAAAAGHAHRFAESNLGLAISSRYPIKSSSAQKLGDSGAVLRATLTTPAGEVDVYTAQIAPLEENSPGLRTGALFLLSEFVRKESAGRPFVLLGDFGLASDDRDTGLLLDLLEARDLCVAHGDELCGRTLGDARVDYILIPYSRWPPKEYARATMTDLVDDSAGDGQVLPHFGLRARLGPELLSLKPARKPEGRDEALGSVLAALEAARAEISDGSRDIGWIPWFGTWEALRSYNNFDRVESLIEQVHSAQIRAD